MDRLQSMRVFQKVVECGGFAAAARKMDLNPPVVTRLVADLERYLGTPLLQRTTRRISLTPAGEDYYARVRTILSELDEADATVRGQATQMQGRIRVLAPSAVAAKVLARATNSFLAQHPGIRVELRAFDLGDPPIEDFDLTFVSGATPLPSDIVTREVGATDQVLCASPAYLRRHGMPQAPAQLAEHRMLRQRVPGDSVTRLRLQSADGREEVVEIEPVLVADSPDTLLQAAIDGGGISLQARAIVKPELDAGLLQRVLAPWTGGSATLVAAYPSRKLLPARARVFLEHVIASVRADLVERDGEAGPGEPRASLRA